MEVIKKKMQAMKDEKDKLCDKIDTLESSNKDLAIRIDKTLEEANGLTRKIQSIETSLELDKDSLVLTNTRLADKEASFNNAESEVNNLNRRVNALEEDFEKSEERLALAALKNAEASQAADDANRMKKVLENRAAEQSERIDTLEAQLKEARFLAEEADRKYDEVAKKLAQIEADLERAEDRADTGETKIIDLEEELSYCGNTLKSLGNAEEHANAREVVYKQQVVNLQKKCKAADARVDFAERTVAKLQKDVDRLEDDLANEKERYRGMTDELDQTFNEISGY